MVYYQLCGIYTLMVCGGGYLFAVSLRCKIALANFFHRLNSHKQNSLSYYNTVTEEILNGVEKRVSQNFHCFFVSTNVKARG